MPRFFTDKIDDKIALISGDDAKHISKVLRYKLGDKLTVCDGNGNDYDCEIISIENDITLKILNKCHSVSEPSVKIKLYQALPKLDKFEFIIQKSVELGVGEIIPIMTNRCISRPTEDKMKHKHERYITIARQAAKQSGRGLIPKVKPLMQFEDAIYEAAKAESAVMFYEGGGAPISSLISENIKELSIIIGSEGGFGEDEVEFARKKGINTATLGPRILRCETAPLAAISIIMNLTGNM